MHNVLLNYFIIASIEGVNIEYGNIENCKIDTILASKMRWLVTSKKNDGKIVLSETTQRMALNCMHRWRKPQSRQWQS